MNKYVSFFLFAFASAVCNPENSRRSPSAAPSPDPSPALASAPACTHGRIKACKYRNNFPIYKAISLIYKLLHEIARFRSVSRPSPVRYPSDSCVPTASAAYRSPETKKRQLLDTAADIRGRISRIGKSLFAHPVAVPRLSCVLRRAHRCARWGIRLGIPTFRRTGLPWSCRHTATLFTIANPVTRYAIPVWESSLAADLNRHTGAAPSERSPESRSASRQSGIGIFRFTGRASRLGRALMRGGFGRFLRAGCLHADPSCDTSPVSSFGIPIRHPRFSSQGNRSIRLPIRESSSRYPLIGFHSAPRAFLTRQPLNSAPGFATLYLLAPLCSDLPV